MVISRRFPPTWPPLRPIADMYAERLAGTGTGGSGAFSAVECSTTHLASWFGSRGLLPLPTVIKQSSHNPIAKRRLWKSKLTHYLVFRPDSGDPVKIIVGDPEAPEGTPEFKGAVQCLWDVFGGTETAKGYKALDSHVGLIYGDSISLDRAQKILAGLQAKGFSSGNIVFGIGSYTYQYVTRDTFGTAIKATYAVIHGEPRELYKDPKTDNGVKKSAQGLIRVEFEDGRFVMHDRQTHEQEAAGLLETVFLDSRMARMQTLKDIRERLAVPV